MSAPFGTRTIGLDSPPLVIAEMSGNHNGSIERALEIVDAAAEAGAHAIKLQTYTPDSMTLDVRSDGFVITDPSSLWYGRSLYDLYAEAQTPWEWHQAIFERARKRGMACLSTPFDQAAVHFLESFDPPAYKVASFELTDLPLVASVAKTGRTLILSTGMATEEEIRNAVDTARENGAGALVLLKCTSTYPASPDDSDIATIADMRSRFQTEAGISDHTAGVGVSVAAVAFGATVIEKHFTLRRADGGVDSAFSIEPDELRTLVTESERAWRARGHVRYGPAEREKGSLAFRRSLYAAQDIRAGEFFTIKNLRIVRPGYGLPPKEFEHVLGRAAAADIKKGTPVTWNLVKERTT